MALPLAAASDAGAAVVFDARFDGLCRRHRELWRRAGEATPRPGPPTTRLGRWRNARAARRLIDRLAAEIPRYPETPAERRPWREGLRVRVSRFGEERLGWPAGYRRLFFADAFLDATAGFSREARAFDPEIGTGELMQALRNVWILNSLQMLLDLEVRLTPAAFAYSMLYPCTDNLLDDPDLPMAVKRRLNRQLGRRLAGEPVAAADAAQSRIWRLLDRIESQYPRAAYPEVWCSLQAIHAGQVDSLRQQTAPSGCRGPRGDVLAPGRLLEISVAKGGASVLADGYLATGRLAPAEADFCFGYGVFLQLLDDLQDARADREAGHATLFSTAEPPLDRLAGRLHRFMRRVVDGNERFAGPRYAARRDLILRNCTTLLVGAVAEEPGLFSRPFRRALERRWPLGLAALRRLRRHADRSLGRAAAELQQRRGVDSLLDLAG